VTVEIAARVYAAVERVESDAVALVSVRRALDSGVWASSRLLDLAAEESLTDYSDKDAAKIADDYSKMTVFFETEREAAALVLFTLAVRRMWTRYTLAGYTGIRLARWVVGIEDFDTRAVFALMSTQPTTAKTSTQGTTTWNFSTQFEKTNTEPLLLLLHALDGESALRAAEFVRQHPDKLEVLAEHHNLFSSGADIDLIQSVIGL
jgi:hypothetical protein